VFDISGDFETVSGIDDEKYVLHVGHHVTKSLFTVTVFAFRDVTEFEFEFERWRISNNFTTFDIHRMLKLPSRRMRIHSLFTVRKCKQAQQLTLT